MKKKFLVVGMSMVMAMAALTGCGSSKDDYKKDVEAFASLSEVDTNTDDMEKMLDDMQSAIDDLDVSTSEGKDIKKDMKELMELTADIMGDMDALADMDEEELEKMQADMEELTEKVEEDVDKFVDAAKEAGLDEEDLADMDNVNGLGL